MVGLSKKLEEKRAKLAGLIERKAFDAYVRHGVVPDDTQQLAETAADGQKFLDLCAGLSIKALPDGRPTTHYTWRTAGDDLVRHTHAALEGGSSPGPTVHQKATPAPHPTAAAGQSRTMAIRHSRTPSCNCSPNGGFPLIRLTSGRASKHSRDRTGA